MLKWILLGIVLLVTVVPALTYLCMKWGIIGFYRGKEVITGQNNIDSEENVDERY